MPILGLSLAIWSAWAPATTEPSFEPLLDPTPVVDLQWSAPTECPSAADIKAAIAELVGRPLGQDPERRMGVTATIHLEANEYRLQLRIKQPDGTTLERRLETSECADLGEPVAVIVAIAVSTSAEPVIPLAPERPGAHTVSRREIKPAVVEPPPATTRDSPTRAPGLPKSEASRAWHAQGALAVAGGIASANLPGVGVAAQVSAGILLGRLRLDVVVTHEFSREQRRRAAGDVVGGRFNLTAVRPEACWRPGRQRWHLPVCLGPELGVVVASGFGVTETQTIQHTRLALVAGPSFVWAVHRSVALRLRTELVVSPARRRFTLAGTDLFTTRAVGARVSGGVEFHFP